MVFDFPSFEVINALVGGPFLKVAGNALVLVRRRKGLRHNDPFHPEGNDAEKNANFQSDCCPD